MYSSAPTGVSWSLKSTSAFALLTLSLQLLGLSHLRKATKHCSPKHVTVCREPFWPLGQGYLVEKYLDERGGLKLESSPSSSWPAHTAPAMGALYLCWQCAAFPRLLSCWKFFHELTWNRLSYRFLSYQSLDIWKCQPLMSSGPGGPTKIIGRAAFCWTMGL